MWALSLSSRGRVFSLGITISLRMTNLCIKICSTKRTLLHVKRKSNKKGSETQVVSATSWGKGLLQAMQFVSRPSNQCKKLSLVHKNDVGKFSVDVGHNIYARMSNGQKHLLWNCSHFYKVNMVICLHFHEPYKASCCHQIVVHVRAQTLSF